jgi:hypothetical protein
MTITIPGWIIVSIVISVLCGTVGGMLSWALIVWYCTKD